MLNFNKAQIMRPKILLSLFLALFFAGNVYAQVFDCPEELFLRQDKKTRLFGYGSLLGEWKIPPTYIKAWPFAGKNAVVIIGKGYGVIDCEGKTIIEPVYESMGIFQYGKGWAKKNELWGLSDWLLGN